ncbi:serine hydrolase [Agaribacter marinus]|uniref:CubicO group peptidase, beta-lactamase class C family n=1 Tax=Agaribacter marinus TaxID=1431249 RepID=A0AA37SWQ7_9ALTE|nr:serine hydrolase [Agaribacter marinus]GLR70962.1 hypothetical protein GCM10007852_18700 [Agaribacter marinus]
MRSSYSQLFRCLLVFSICIGANATANIDKNALKNTVEQALKAFHTPGMSITIVQNDAVVLSQGYGFSQIDENIPVTSRTYFRLASVSKAFTAAGVAILVDEGRLGWDDLVIDHLPDFRLQDNYATQNFTVKDLLTHNSGLISGAGDSMIWPEPSGFNRDEVVQNLRYFSAEYAFKSRYAYSNVMYITAGVLIEKLSKIPFERFIDERIFSALDIPCYSGAHPTDVANASAMGYAHSDARGIYPVPRNAITGDALMSAAAGGMICNADGMSKWLNALLSIESLPFSKKQLDLMWQGHTILNVPNIDKQWNDTHFKEYGLGWRLSNIGEYKVISHTGTLSGYQAYVALIPELSLGVSIFNNGSNYGARGAVMQTILKHYINAADANTDENNTESGQARDNSAANNTTYIDSERAQTAIDWTQKYIDYQAIREKRWLQNNAPPVANSDTIVNVSDIVGTYKDDWFGDLVIYVAPKGNNDEKLRIRSSRMKTLKGTLSPFQDATYKIDWDNENAQGDAFIHFDLNVERTVTGASLHPFTKRKKRNHAYRDMYFNKLDPESTE